jgi:TonB family protein
MGSVWKPVAVAYNAESAGVVAPVPITQGLPAVPAEIARFGGEKRGVLEVTIEPTGRVGSVVVRESLNPSYDRLAVEAARHWQFKPALKDGQPVRFVKFVAVELKVQ